MPFPGFHAARLIDPSRFEANSMRTKEITGGILLIVGKLKGQPRMTAQSYRFAVDKFSSDEAKKWLSDHGIKTIAFEAAARKIAALVQTFTKAGNLLSADEIMELIPKEVLGKIKTKNATPFFQAFSLCHEGTSKPTLLGDTARPISWTRRAIQTIKGLVTRGVKFFIGHNSDSSTEGRESVGEIVADTQREINGKLHHIIIGYFPDKERVRELDVNSQEAVWDLIETGAGLVADKIQKLTGVALADSRKEQPAFSEARRLGFVQAFEQIFDDGINGGQPKDTDGESENHPGEGSVGETRKVKKMSDLENVTVAEIAAVCKKRSIVPSMLFNVEDMKADNKFMPVFAEVDALKKAQTEKDAKIKELTDAVSESGKKLEQSTAKARLGKLLDDDGLKLTPKQKAYVEKHFSGITDTSDAGLKTFLEGELARYKIDAELFGDKDVGLKQAEKSGIGDDFTKTENNEFLKQDIVV